MINWNFTNNTNFFQEAYEDAVANAMEEIGLLAEGYAQGYCSVDTGRLKNSINHATALGVGEDAYTDNNGKAYTGRSGKSMPDAYTCYIGTNVEYASYQEFGTSKIDAANHDRGFLRPAISNHIGKYESIVFKELGTIVSFKPK